MAGDVWNRLIPQPEASHVSGALGRVWTRASVRRTEAARRRRVLALAAGFALTFAAGWLAGHASVAGGRVHDRWALGGPSIEEGRASFVAVPANDR